MKRMDIAQERSARIARDEMIVLQLLHGAAPVSLERRYSMENESLKTAVRRTIKRLLPKVYAVNRGLSAAKLLDISRTPLILHFCDRFPMLQGRLD